MIKRVLVIIDPDQENLFALNRASLIAEKTDCELEVLLSVDTPRIHRIGMLGSEGILDDIRLAEKEKLDSLVQPLVDYGFTVKTSLVLQSPAIRGIMDGILNSQVDLVIKTSDYQPSIKRSLFSYLDWQLIHDCPKPLLLCKHDRWSEHPNIAVAVDPMHEQDEPADLDSKLVENGQLWQGITEGDLQLLHACDSSSVSTAVSTLEEYQEKHLEALTALAQKHSISEGSSKMLLGMPEYEIAEYVNTNNIDLLVTGAISRSFFEKKIIGYTAERLLDKLHCDLLVIKAG